jgi:ssDNA-binding Zn-finger/Zn-ribbon topoisomerase 1
MVKRWRQRRLFRRLVLEEVERSNVVLKDALEAMEDEARKLRRELRDPLAPECPRCQGELVIRTAVKSRNPGTLFWGCRNWPKCTYTAGADEIVEQRMRSYAV